MRNAFGAIFILAFLATGCGEKTPPCSGNYKSIAGQVGDKVHSCQCTADQVTGSVWGSGIYTTDSSICKAAVHAGAVPATGGVVKVKGANGCERYVGTAQNGINTGKWGAYEMSFLFPGHGDGKCAPGPPKDACPRNFKALLKAQGSKPSYTCSCSADQLKGSVWGSGIYTTDSSICKAAVHAGAIPATGGKVTLKADKGCNAYAGSLGNGIKSSKWGAYQMSFVFPGHGSGVCAAGPAKGTCPRNFKAIAGTIGPNPHTCTCTAAQINGSVWGHGPYTTDSSICKAAVHAGAMPASGGEITVKAAAGCNAYSSTTANGVKSSKWGPYQQSFIFPGKGGQACK